MTTFVYKSNKVVYRFFAVNPLFTLVFTFDLKELCGVGSRPILLPIQITILEYANGAAKNQKHLSAVGHVDDLS